MKKNENIVSFTNRYGDKFTFQLMNNGNIAWRGVFEYCRIGWPNDYEEAYKKWHNDFPKTEMLSLEDFKNIVHTYDDEKSEYPYIEYLKLVKAKHNEIDMVDPSGGPYLTTGMDMDYINKSFKGMLINGFEKTYYGYEIKITKS